MITASSGSHIVLEDAVCVMSIHKEWQTKDSVQRPHMFKVSIASKPLQGEESQTLEVVVNGATSEPDISGAVSTSTYYKMEKLVSVEGLREIQAHYDSWFSTF